MGRLDGTAIVELTLGQVLCAVGQRDEGRAVLTRSRDAFARLGQDEMARQAQAAIDACAW